jgi:MoaA/NifB/PqqE/SkfB family radical SAM enzyme
MRHKTIGFLVTNYCNNKCDFCGVNTTSDKNKVQYLSSKDMIKCISIASELNYKKVGFSDGEPISRINDIIKTIRYAKSKNMKTFLVTNASYASNLEKAKYMTYLLEKAGLNFISFSFDYDHLLNIPYNNYLYAITTALKSKIKISILVVDKKKTRDKNTKLLQKLAKNLNFHYKTTLSSKLFEWVIGGYCERFNLMISSKGNIQVSRMGLDYAGSAKKLKNEFQLKKSKDVLFMIKPYSCYCVEQPITIRWDKKIFNCCSFEALDCDECEIGNLDGNLEEIFSRSYQLSLIEIIRLYLFVKNSKNVEKNLNKRYANLCHLCVQLKKNLKFKNLKEPTKIQLFRFIIKNFPLFVITQIRIILLKYVFVENSIAGKLVKSLTKIH